MSQKRNVLCFGDSLTWGWIPVEGAAPTGVTRLPSCIASHLPLDLVVLMLGTNDTKAYFHRSAFEIAAGVSVLLRQIVTSAGGVGTSYPAPTVLLVSPPPLGAITDPWFKELFAGGQEKSAELGRLYRALADFAGVAFLDAGSVLTTDGVDGIHFSAENNADLADAIHAAISELL